MVRGTYIFIFLLIGLSFVSANSFNKLPYHNNGWIFEYEKFEDDYDGDGIPDVTTTFNLTDNVLEVYANMTRDKAQNYKWSSVICAYTDIQAIEKEEYNPNTDVWTNTGALTYGPVVNFGMPSHWCNETGGEGFILFGAGAADKQYRLLFNDDDASKRFKIYTGSGSEEVTVTYQNISAVYYEAVDGFNVTTILEEGTSNRTNYATNYPEVVIINSSSYKFGAYRYNATEHLEFRYTFESTNPIQKDSKGYYILGNSKQKGLTRTFKKHYINTDDICYSWYNETDDTSFSSDCTYNQYKENETYYLEVYFTGEYTGNSTMFIDPSYDITSVTAANSYDTNITAEDGFNHLDVSEEGIFTNLTIYYTFDSNSSLFSNTVFDMTNNSWDASVVNTVYSVDDAAYGRSMYFDGTDDYLLIANEKILTSTTGTVSAWVRFNSTSEAFQCVLSYGGTGNEALCVGITQYGGGGPYVGVAGRNPTTTVGGNTTLSQDTWTHIAVSSNGTRYKYYVNGVLETGETIGLGSNNGEWFGSKNPTSPLNTRVGVQYRWGAVEYDFNGSIDELMAFDHQLSDAEILEIYNNQSLRYKPQGVQSLLSFNITNPGNNTINVTTYDIEELEGSTLENRINYWQPANGYNDTVNGSDFASDMVVYYHFDNLSAQGESNSNVNDFSGNNFDGTPGNQATPDQDEGVFNGSFLFDGTNDRVVLDSGAGAEINNFGTGFITVAAWAKGPAGETGTGFILDDTQSNLEMYMDANEKYNCRLDTSGSIVNIVSSFNSYTDEAWHHIVCVYNGTHAYIFVDGIKQPDVESFSGNLDTIGTLNFGEDYEGYIDEFILSQKAYSDDEVNELYVKGRANWNTTAYQDVDEGVTNQFSINTEAQNFYVDYRYTAGNSTVNGFYSPVMYQNISFELTDVSGADTTPPVLSVYNITVDNVTAISADFNATDNVAIDTFLVNDTTNFSIDGTGLFTNATTLSVGIYWVNVSVNDTSGNIDWEVIKVNVTEVTPIDTSFTVSLPLGYVDINFSSNTKTVSNLNADGQNTTDGVLEITNTGDVVLDVFLEVNATASGFTLFADTDNNPSGATTITATAQQLVTALATATSQDVWMWVNWTDKTPQTIERKLNVSVQEN